MPAENQSCSSALAAGCAAYVHFPYCLEKCPYCDFVSYAKPRAQIDHAAYADAVLAELRARAPAYAGRRLGSLFFGGGTPSLWHPRELGRVIAGVRAAFAADDADLEVTVECNPTSLDRAHADALAEVGVNRLSIGVQSLDDQELRFLGRLHDSRGALAALEGALASRIERISADLIIGLPEQAPSRAAEHAERLARLGLSHLSVYQLTIEPGTRFGELAKRGRLPMADDGKVADGFLAVHAKLAEFGLRHYEISNYAKPGQEAQHNLAYWHGAEYLGLGTGAVGFVRTDGRPARGVRYRNEVLPERYVQRAQAMPSGTPGADDGLAESHEWLDGEALLRERIMLGLRLAEGFDLEAQAADLGVPAWPSERQRALDWLRARERIQVSGTQLLIPPSAWLFTDDTAARLF